MMTRDEGGSASSRCDGRAVQVVGDEARGARTGTSGITPAILGLGVAVTVLCAGCASAGEDGTRRVSLPQWVEPPPVAPGPWTPRVHIEIERGSRFQNVELRQLTGWDLEHHSVQGPGGGVSGDRVTSVSRLVCAAPCDVVVDARRGQQFFFAGPDVNESAHFRLGGGNSDVRFTVSPGSSSSEKAGAPLLGIGGLGMLVGAVILGIAAANRSDLKAGAGVLGGGTALASAGLALLLSSRTTFVTRSATPADAPR